MRFEEWCALHADELRCHAGRWVALDPELGIVASHDAFEEVARLAAERAPNRVPIMRKVGINGVFETIPP